MVLVGLVPLLVAGPAVGPGPVRSAVGGIRLAAAEAEPAADEPDAPPEHVAVDAAHRLFLGRGATDVERDRWTPTVAWGDRVALARALAVSDEWVGTRVDALYRQVLGRAAEPGGRAHWVGYVADGGTVEAVSALLHGSDEYLDRVGGTTEAVVRAWYESLLERTPDADGLAYWTGRVEGGLPRHEAVSGFLDSVESRRDRVRRTYHDVLGRGPDPAGLAFWTGALLDLGDVVLAAELAASDEWYRRATGEAPPPAPARGRGTGHAPVARHGGVVVHHPVLAGERVGFHEAGHDGARPLAAEPTAVGPFVLPSRGRPTGPTTSADVVVLPDAEVRAPVTGVVVAAEDYLLYCRHPDARLLLAPDGDPDLLLAVLHVTGLLVEPGDRVQAGVTPIAERATPLPFTSQIDRYGATPSWPHVHLELFDPDVPDEDPLSC